MMATNRRRVLIIDDNKSLVVVAARVLEKEGYDVSTAFDGVEGVAKAQTERPDLIILDIGMPGTNGYEVCRELKMDPNTANIPVVFLSSKGNLNEREGPSAIGLKEVKLAYSLGATNFIHKPISARELIAAVNDVFILDKILSSD